MKERIEKLKRKGYFKSALIDEKGFGTFIRKHKMQNMYLCKAKKYKGEGDLVIKSKKLKAIDMYVNAMINYIKGYREEELNLNKENIIGFYNGLYKYSIEIYNMIEETSVYKLFVQRVLVAVKFHILGLETKHAENELGKNVYELYTLFTKSSDFYKIDDLEDLYKKM